MRSKKVNKNVIMMIIVLFITLGYAYLNSELKINGTTGIAGNTWDVHFENVVPSSSNTATVNTAPVANPQDKVTELTYSVKFNKPGDIYEFDVDIVNAGSIDAMVELIASTIKIGNGEEQELTNDTLPSYLNYYVKYSDGVSISSNHLLNKETRETIRVHVEYKMDITNEDLVESAGKTIKFTYGLNYAQATSSAKARPLANNCTYNGELIQGATYTNGQYTYGYMQEGSSSGWSNITNDGWGVKLTNSNSTDPVTTPLCTTINGKPIVSMSYAFNNSKATSIDLSSFDTSSVTNMRYMFSNLGGTTTLDVGYLDTSKVKNMEYMFSNGEKLAIISNFDNFSTKNVTNMQYMFAYSKKIEDIKITKWDVSKVTNVDYMFEQVAYNSPKLNLEVRNFNLPNVNSVNLMFSNIGINVPKSKIIIDNINLENAITAPNLFYYMNNYSGVVDITISNINLSSVTNPSYTFEAIGSNSYNSLKLNINNINLASASNIEATFNYVAREANVAIIKIDNININGANNISSGFDSVGQKAKELDFTVSNLHARSATKAESCFGYVGQSSNNTKLIVKNWDTPELLSVNSMFANAGQIVSNTMEINVDNINMQKVTNADTMFYSVGENGTKNTKIIIKNISTPNLSSAKYLFEYADAINSLTVEGLDNFDFSHVTNFKEMFKQFAKDYNSIIDLGTIDFYGDDISSMFDNSKSLKLVLNLHTKPSSYLYAFSSAAVNNGSKIIVNYSSEVDNIDDIIATKSSNSNVIKGQLID